MEKRKIYFIIDTMGVGGAETQLLRIIPHLQKLDWEIQLVTLKEKNEFKAELDSMRVPFRSLGFSGRLSTTLNQMRILASEINREAGNKRVVIHSHIVSSNLFSRFLTLFLKKEIILVNTIHNTNEGANWRYWLYKATRNRAHYVSAMSRAALDVHKKRKSSREDRLHLVYNGIDLSLFRYDEKVRERMRHEFALQDAFVWLAVGNLSPQKNFVNLLRAWKLAQKEEGIDARLYIVGEGVEKNMLEETIDEYGLKEDVRLLGRRNDVQDLMSMADGYVMSSDWEGFPMVLLAAAASELPIVATDVGGNSEIVLDGKNGYICPPKKPEALVQSMQKLMKKPSDTLRSMGRAGRFHVSNNFSVESIAAQWDDIYRTLIESK